MNKPLKWNEGDRVHLFEIHLTEVGQQMASRPKYTGTIYKIECKPGKFNLLITIDDDPGYMNLGIHRRFRTTDGILCQEIEYGYLTNPSSSKLQMLTADEYQPIKHRNEYAETICKFWGDVHEAYYAQSFTKLKKVVEQMDELRKQRRAMHLPLNV